MRYRGVENLGSSVYALFFSQYLQIEQFTMFSFHYLVPTRFSLLTTTSTATITAFRPSIPSSSLSYTMPPATTITTSKVETLLISTNIICNAPYLKSLMSEPFLICSEFSRRMFGSQCLNRFKFLQIYTFNPCSGL